MKKIFTLIAVATMAISAQAQKITWTEDDIVSAGNLDGKTFSNEGFVLTLTDTDGKIAIDKNSAWFGTAESQEKSAGGRLKSGGKSSSKNQMKLTIPTAGTLKVYVRTGSNSATDRNLILTQDETELYNQVVEEAQAVKVKGLDDSDPDKDTNVYPIISVSVAAGEVIVTYPTGSMNFYGFELATSTGITSVKAAAQDGAIYNVAGQKVGSDYKGLVIKNGKKFIQK